MLDVLPGLIGTKTGITTAAGPCFAGYYENLKENTKIVMILCHSSSQIARWTEIEEMVDWYNKEKEKQRIVKKRELAKQKYKIE